MSDVHRHTPSTFLGLRNSVGATWYIYTCECGIELPERRIPAPGIERRNPVLLPTAPTPQGRAHKPRDGRCSVCGYRLGALAPRFCPSDS